eukprot:9201855-Alexandrium_andersonii.AAC.1
MPTLQSAQHGDRYQLPLRHGPAGHHPTPPLHGWDQLALPMGGGSPALQPSPGTVVRMGGRLRRQAPRRGPARTRLRGGLAAKL